MITLFENNEFRLLSTGHDYDFVGIIETKTDEPLTFFFNEELCDSDDENSWDDICIDESQTQLLDVYKGLKEYNHSEGIDEEQETAECLQADSYFRTRDDRSTGFLSEPRQRGQFLALVKNYCPDQLKAISWA